MEPVSGSGSVGDSPEHAAQDHAESGDKQAMTRVPIRLKSVSFTVPLVPPSVNHYKMPRRGGKGFYVTEEAQAFKKAVAIFAKGAHYAAEECRVELGIYLGKGGRGDIDNFLKVTLDGLVSAGVINSDAHIKALSVFLGRDWDNPRTEITVRAI